VDKLVLSVNTFDDPSVRLQNILKDGGIRHVYQVVRMTEQDFLGLKGSLKRSLKETKKLLAEFGLSLGMKLDEKTLAEIKKRIPQEDAKMAEAPPAVQPTEGKPTGSPSMRDVVDKFKGELQAKPVVELPFYASLKEGMVLDTNIPMEDVQEAMDIGFKLKYLRPKVSQAKEELSKLGELVKAETMGTVSEILKALEKAFKEMPVRFPIERNPHG